MPACAVTSSKRCAAAPGNSARSAAASAGGRIAEMRGTVTIFSDAPFGDAVHGWGLGRSAPHGRGKSPGVVVADDGMPFLSPVEVRLHCAGSGNRLDRRGRHGAVPLPRRASNRRMRVERLRGGLRVSRTPVRGLPAAAGIPALVLRRAGKYQGETISVSHLAALPVARAPVSTRRAQALRQRNRRRRGFLAPRGRDRPAVCLRLVRVGPLALGARRCRRRSPSVCPGGCGGIHGSLPPTSRFCFWSARKATRKRSGISARSSAGSILTGHTDARRASSFAPRAQPFRRCFSWRYRRAGKRWSCRSALSTSPPMSAGKRPRPRLPATGRRSRPRCTAPRRASPATRACCGRWPFAHFQAGRWFAAAPRVQALRSHRAAARGRPFRLGDGFFAARAPPLGAGRTGASGREASRRKGLPLRAVGNFLFLSVVRASGAEQLEAVIRLAPGFAPAPRPPGPVLRRHGQAREGRRGLPAGDRIGQSIGPEIALARLSSGQLAARPGAARRSESGAGAGGRRRSAAGRRPLRARRRAAQARAVDGGRESLERAVALEPENTQALPALA